MPPQLVSRARRLSIRFRAGILGAICGLVLLVIVAVQNNRPTLVRFIAWSWPGTALFVVILCSVGVGFVVGVVFMLPGPGARRERDRSAPPSHPSSGAGEGSESDGPGATTT